MSQRGYCEAAGRLSLRRSIVAVLHALCTNSRRMIRSHDAVLVRHANEPMMVFRCEALGPQLPLLP